MSNVYKRPMFRRGGSTNMNGIMDGITDREDREKFNEGSNNPLLQYPTDYFPTLGTREIPSAPEEVRSAPSIRNDSDSS